MSILKSIAKGPLESWTMGRPDVVRKAVQSAWRELKTAGSARRWKRKFSRFQGQKNLKLNIGSGPKVKEGWVNIDLLDHPEIYKFDLRFGLPFDDNSCTFVFNEHVLEHLEYVDGLFFLKEAYRVLQPGGALKIILPDFEAIFAAYLKKDRDYFDLVSDSRLVRGLDKEDRTMIDFVGYAVYQYGEHRALYDEEKLLHILKKVGFRSVERSTFDPATDSGSTLRTKYSLYIQAVK